MNTPIFRLFACILCVSLSISVSHATDMDDILSALTREISGNRARDYTMRLWQYDKWSTLPMWNNTAREASDIMVERGFDEAVVIDTPADGFTKFGDWTNPIGWDCTGATLEIVEPADIPDEFRILCNYLDNPTSLNNYSCPTPPEGVVAELVLLDRADPKELENLDVDGKVLLLPSGSRAMKRHLDPNGALGIVTDEIEGNAADFIDANRWLNGWSDMPGGWQMNGHDSRNNFGFAISQKKGAYLRGLLRRGVKVTVRARIDSRYYTDGALPYVVGSIEGSSLKDEDVLVVSHIYEWGANDDCTGAAIDLEAIGTLNDLIRRGILPRPKRTIRMWLGFECYGSMAYTVHNLDRLRNRTLAILCNDSPAMDYDLHVTRLQISTNFNACPSFTDAVFPNVVGQYYDTYEPTRSWVQTEFMGGLDNYFGDPMIGVPINAMYMSSNAFLHHNSMDTIEKVDPRTLREASIINAAYLYYLADAAGDELPQVARLAFDRARKVVGEIAASAREKALGARDGESLGTALVAGMERIDYYAALQKDAIASVARLVRTQDDTDVMEIVARYSAEIDAFALLMKEHFRAECDLKARTESMRIIAVKEEKDIREQEAESLVPKRNVIGMLTLEGIPHEEWAEVTGSPRWWSATNVAAASYFWCDGERNLNEIKALVEMESGQSIGDFDLISYYTFLEKHDIIAFVK
jgi:hypothetical protein